MAAPVFSGNFACSSNLRLSCTFAAPIGNTVVVTRERGKNEKLMKALGCHGISCLELPLIQHTRGPELEKLPVLLNEKQFQWVTVTSPEAAAVFLDGWKRAGFPKVQIAVVGEGTATVFESIEQRKDHLQIGFIPSKATAKVLAAELPLLNKTNAEVLYPASVKASDELTKGLQERGFSVCRLNTYSTEAVQIWDEKAVEQAMKASVVTFGSPSCVRAWVQVISGWDGGVACIGNTTAVAAKNAGFRRVYYPDKPGLQGWVQSVLSALKEV